MNIKTKKVEIPSVEVAIIHSFDFAEDGKTLVVMADMVDGTTVLLSLCPGSPISISIHPGDKE